MQDSYSSASFFLSSKRESVPKYAYVADIQTEIIEKNAYNLNIPRYVDISEEEEEIDLQQVVKDIKQIDSEIAEVSASLKKSFDELGLEIPFKE